MGRILGLDIGRKRCGIAVTDPLRIIPGGLGYQPTHLLPDWVKDYCAKERVDMIVIGLPKQANNTESESMQYIRPVVNRLKKLLPDMEIIPYDERYTSVLAHRAVIEGGIKKMARREKGLIDEVSAVIILQDFMESKVYKDSYK